MLATAYRMIHNVAFLHHIQYAACLVQLYGRMRQTLIRKRTTAQMKDDILFANQLYEFIKWRSRL
jgi:hypothetical protein